MQFYRVEDVEILLGVSTSKAYKVIRELGDELEKEGYHRPPAGRIQKCRFCEKFLMDMEDCDKELRNKRIKGSDLCAI